MMTAYVAASLNARSVSTGSRIRAATFRLAHIVTERKKRRVMLARRPNGPLTETVGVLGWSSAKLRKSVKLQPLPYVVGCAFDCHAMNFQPFGVFVQALRNTSLRLRGWPLISASIAARPVTSAVSPARRTLRSLQAVRLYFVFPERREASHVALVSVSPEEWVYRSSSWSIASSAAKSPPHIAA